MPKHALHYRVPVVRPLPQLVPLLARTARTNVPVLWVVWKGKHRLPYARPAPPADKDQAINTMLEPVRLDDGSPLGTMATRVDTCGSASCLPGGYLVSDGFQCCVPVVGVSPFRTYLAHVATASNFANQFRGWDDTMRVMIVRRAGHAGHTVMTEKLKEHFGPRSFFLDVSWSCDIAVIVHKSTCIVYQEDLSDDEGPAAAASPARVDANANAAAVPLPVAAGAAAAAGSASASASASAAAAALTPMAAATLTPMAAAFPRPAAAASATATAAAAAAAVAKTNAK